MNYFSSEHFSLNTRDPILYSISITIVKHKYGIFGKKPKLLKKLLLEIFKEHNPTIDNTVNFFFMFLLSQLV